MAIGFILGVVLVVLILVCGFIAVTNKLKRKNRTLSTVAAILVAVFILALLTVPLSFHTVDTGEVAVVKHLGQAKEVKTAGTYFNFWLTNEYQTYDAKVQNVAIETAAYSSDAQTMNIQMNLQYQILSDKVLNIANQYGSLEALNTRIQAIAIEKTKATLSSHKAMDIIADRAAMSPAVEEAVRVAVGEEYFVNIVSVVLTNIDFSDAFENAVEEKMIAEQQQLKSEYENQTKVAKAEADAKAKLVAAEAQAKANELLEQTLTDKILQEMYINKWNGVLPQVVAGEEANLMIPTTNNATN
ncbi:MAG: prohibitin family protein [Clostridia bacterium]|nr:prohibitin family protein [Clostridia bacterium]